MGQFAEDYTCVPDKTAYIPGRIKANKDMLARFKLDLCNCEKKLKDVAADKSLSFAEKERKLEHIREIIKNLNESIARQTGAKEEVRGR